MSDPFDDADVRRNADGSYTVTFGGVINHDATGHGAKYHTNADAAMAYYFRIVRRIGGAELDARRKEVPS